MLSNEHSPIYFTKVFIYGILTNYYVKEAKNGRRTIKLSITIKRNENTAKNTVVDKTSDQFLPAEIDVFVEKGYLVEKYQKGIQIGTQMIIEGKISLMFIRSGDVAAKRIQYISVDNILTDQPKQQSVDNIT